MSERSDAEPGPADVYRPIDCGYHDLLESLAVRRIRCEIVYRDHLGATCSAESRILDVFTEGREEFIRLEGGEMVRLDRLVSVDGSPRP